MHSGLSGRDSKSLSHSRTMGCTYRRNVPFKSLKVNRQEDTRRFLLYQLMKELFPAEWLPISITVIFFLGGSNFTPTDSATEISPEEDDKRELRGLMSKMSMRNNSIQFNSIQSFSSIQFKQLNNSPGGQFSLSSFDVVKLVTVTKLYE